MQIAITIWRDRVSPVFDSASRALILKFGATGEMERFEATLDQPLPAQRAARLIALGIDELVCGAISRPLYVMFDHAGVRLTTWVTGSIQEVVHAIQTQGIGALNDLAYQMPACCPGRGRRDGSGRGFGRRRRFRRGRRGQGGNEAGD